MYVCHPIKTYWSIKFKLTICMLLFEAYCDLLDIKSPLLLIQLCTTIDRRIMIYEPQ